MLSGNCLCLHSSNRKKKEAVHTPIFLYQADKFALPLLDAILGETAGGSDEFEKAYKHMTCTARNAIRYAGGQALFANVRTSVDPQRPRTLNKDTIETDFELLRTHQPWAIKLFVQFVQSVFEYYFAFLGLLDGNGTNLRGLFPGKVSKSIVTQNIEANLSKLRSTNPKLPRNATPTTHEQSPHNTSSSSNTFITDVLREGWSPCMSRLDKDIAQAWRDWLCGNKCGRGDSEDVFLSYAVSQSHYHHFVS
jgi:hypothetical protein